MKTNVIFADEFQPDFIKISWEEDSWKEVHTIDMEKFSKWNLNTETKTLIIGYRNNLTNWATQINIAIKLGVLPQNFDNICEMISSRRKVSREMLEAEAKKRGY